MVRLISVTGDYLPITGAAPLCLAMLAFCAAGCVVSIVLVSIARARLSWAWASASISAWMKAFAGFLFLYAVQIADKQNGDLSYANFALVGIAGVLLVFFELDERAQRNTNPRAPAQLERASPAAISTAQASLGSPEGTPSLRRH